jgi:cytochrome b
MEQTRDIEVWDLFVRVFHWTLVTGFFIAYFTEEDLLGLHVWAGYVVFSLLMLRLAWGFVGTAHARFRDFVYGPTRVLGHLKEMVSARPQRYIGHSPAGGAMVIALLLGLLATAFTGFIVYGAQAEPGLMASLAATFGVVGKEGAEAFEEVHEVLANVTLALVGLHVLGVLAASLSHRENLVRALITGRKRA